MTNENNAQFNSWGKKSFFFGVKVSNFWRRQVRRRQVGPNNEASGMVLPLYHMGMVINRISKKCTSCIYVYIHFFL